MICRHYALDLVRHLDALDLALFGFPRALI